MKNPMLSVAVCVLAALGSGCASKSHFDNVSKTYEMEIKKRQSEEKALRKALEQCMAHNGNLEKDITALNQHVTEKEKLISLQQTAIRLVDDSEKTLQSSIEEQLNNKQ